MSNQGLIFYSLRKILDKSIEKIVDSLKEGDNCKLGYKITHKDFNGKCIEVIFNIKDSEDYKIYNDDSRE